MLWKLFASFFKIGLFTFGGGYAMIPLMERELIDKHKWLNKEELLEIISIAQITPGTIAINAATYVGRKEGGISGALGASLGVIAPSFIIITLIYHLFSHNFDNPYIQKAFTGARAAVVALIGYSFLKIFKAGIKDRISIGLFAIACVLLFIFNIHPILLISIGGISGLLLTVIFPDQMKSLFKPQNKKSE
ncbi:chromate transporter [Limibacter armeniacum]|uniref:chromate transporter n=1 Tax=Limibacter armeniacum TaxID=466084 RepID=UPI002FE569C8